MPPLYIVVGADWQRKYTPVSWLKDGTVYPLLLDVSSQVAEGLGLCLDTKAHEHLVDLVVRQEREGHKFSDVPVHCVITTIGCLETKLLQWALASRLYNGGKSPQITS